MEISQQSPAIAGLSLRCNGIRRNVIRTVSPFKCFRFYANFIVRKSLRLQHFTALNVIEICCTAKNRLLSFFHWLQIIYRRIHEQANDSTSKLVGKTDSHQTRMNCLCSALSTR